MLTVPPGTTGGSPSYTTIVCKSTLSVALMAEPNLCLGQAFFPCPCIWVPSTLPIIPLSLYLKLTLKKWDDFTFGSLFLFSKTLFLNKVTFLSLMCQDNFLWVNLIYYSENHICYLKTYLKRFILKDKGKIETSQKCRKTWSLSFHSTF